MKNQLLIVSVVLLLALCAFGQDANAPESNPQDLSILKAQPEPPMLGLHWARGFTPAARAARVRSNVNMMLDAVDADFAVVATDVGLADAETEAGAASALSGEKRLEDVGEDVGWNAGSRIADADLDVVDVGQLAGGDGDAAAFGSSFRGVEQQVHGVEQSFKLALAGLDGLETVFQLASGFVEGGGDLADFVDRSCGDTGGEIASCDPIGEGDDALQTASRVLGAHDGEQHALRCEDN